MYSTILYTACHRKMHTDEILPQKSPGQPHFCCQPGNFLYLQSAGAAAPCLLFTSNTSQTTPSSPSFCGFCASAYRFLKVHGSRHGRGTCGLQRRSILTRRTSGSHRPSNSGNLHPTAVTVRIVPIVLIAQTAETAQVIRQGMQRRAHTKIPQIA